ncbi:hypothetical protein MICAI_2290009 [Microcystis sp. T1-4]|nr:hypothetical protein MICAI_2290009 [Microcystis sp. T1-4]
MLLGLGVSSRSSGELGMNNNQLNGLFKDFMQFNPYSYRF